MSLWSTMTLNIIEDIQKCHPTYFLRSQRLYWIWENWQRLRFIVTTNVTNTWNMLKTFVAKCYWVPFLLFHYVNEHFHAWLEKINLRVPDLATLGDDGSLRKVNRRLHYKSYRLIVWSRTVANCCYSNCEVLLFDEVVNLALKSFAVDIYLFILLYFFIVDKNIIVRLGAFVVRRHDFHQWNEWIQKPWPLNEWEIELHTCSMYPCITRSSLPLTPSSEFMDSQCLCWT